MGREYKGKGAEPQSSLQNGNPHIGDKREKKKLQIRGIVRHEKGADRPVRSSNRAIGEETKWVSPFLDSAHLSL